MLKAEWSSRKGRMLSTRAILTAVICPYLCSVYWGASRCESRFVPVGSGGSRTWEKTKRNRGHPAIAARFAQAVDWWPLTLANWQTMPLASETAFSPFGALRRDKG